MSPVRALFRNLQGFCTLMCRLPSSTQQLIIVIIRWSCKDFKEPCSVGPSELWDTVAVAMLPVNRGTCVIQLTMLQENDAVTAQLSCTHQLSPFGKESLHFLKAKYLQLLQSVHPECPPPLAYGLSRSYNTEIWWSPQLSSSLAVKCWHSQLCVLLDIDWHQYFSWLTLKPNTHGSILRIWWRSMSATNKHPQNVQNSPQN